MMATTTMTIIPYLTTVHASSDDVTGAETVGDEQGVVTVTARDVTLDGNRHFLQAGAGYCAGGWKAET